MIRYNTIKSIFLVPLFAGLLFFTNTEQVNAQFLELNKVKLCHNGNTIEVSINAVQAHLNHGDFPGVCNPPPGCIDSSQIDPTLFCIALFDPVCGCNGVTYSNSCFAFINGVTSFTNGVCGCIDPSKIDPGAICPAIFDPVCGCDGETYSNSCVATAAGVTSFTSGKCGGVIVPGKWGMDEETGQVTMEEEAPANLNHVIHPNPFSGTTTISFGFPKKEEVKIDVFDITGAHVATLFNGMAEKDKEYKVVFDGRDLDAGMYMYTITTSGETIMDKMMLVK